MSLNYDVGSDSQERYFPSKYFNPQLITLWVQCAEDSEGLVVELGGDWRLEEGVASLAWHILPVSDTPFFPRGLWEESNRATSGASCWIAGGVDSGPGKKPRGCMHGAPTAAQVLTHPLNPPANKCAWLIRDVTQFVIDLNVKSEV